MARSNILFIMCDQLRYDYIGCTGHPTLQTPAIDALARRGVTFRNAYVQSTICGPSRMSAYTGRYVRSHGSSQNGVPLRIGEPTLGDHLRAAGIRPVLIGKTHMVADEEGMARLGIARDSVIGVEASQCGFEPFERDDGLHPGHPKKDQEAYSEYLRAKGYDGDSPWESWANSAQAEDGSLLDGWLLSHADKPARIADEDSETPYLTGRAMEFMRMARADGRPWCAHLSYIKPHWPYIVPAPYHDMYGANDVLPAVRNERELQDRHPIMAAFQRERVSQAFARDEVRQRVIPAYMGLIRQIDDQLARLFSFMEDEQFLDDTMIVFTSDHGDYLGDHWLGEKQLFHDASVRVPMIVVDPDKRADSTRGSVSAALVEMIDLAPTFLDWHGHAIPRHVLEGRSLLPLLRGEMLPSWREAVVSEYDYAWDAARSELNVGIEDCRMTMLFDGRWKYVNVPGFRPMLFDLQSDPQEFNDVGGEPSCLDVCERMMGLLLRWYRHARSRITYPDERILKGAERSSVYDRFLDDGIKIGYWDEAEVARELKKKLSGGFG